MTFVLCQRRLGYHERDKPDKRATAVHGFPPLNLETIDFVALYRNELARRQAEQGAAPVS